MKFEIKKTRSSFGIEMKSKVQFEKIYKSRFELKYSIDLLISFLLLLNDDQSIINNKTNLKQKNKKATWKKQKKHRT